MTSHQEAASRRTGLIFSGIYTRRLYTHAHVLAWSMRAHHIAHQVPVVKL